MQRKMAYEIIKASLVDKEFANLNLKKRLNELKPIQRGFVTELVNGVLRNYYLLEYQFIDYVDAKSKIDLKIILAMSIYERFFLGKDAFVTVNEYVELAKNKSEKGFINAVLRKIDTFKEPDTSNIEGIAIAHSLPLWIAKMLYKQYDQEMFNYLITDLENEPKVFYRINPNKATYDTLKHLDIEMIDERIFIAKENLIKKEEFIKGYYYVQDYNSSKIVDFLSLEAKHRYLDVCSAPGSKLFNALEIVDEENVYANDLHAHRLELIKKRAKELGYSKINYLNQDATTLKSQDIGLFDRILVDAPCSGLGVLKRKPDLRYRIEPNNIDEIVKVQADILDTCADLLNIGGIMVYSTCTINTKENRKQVANFIKRHPNFELVEDKDLIERADSDRFYVAKLLKTA